MINSGNASPSRHIRDLGFTGRDGARPRSALSARREVVSKGAHPARILGRRDRSGTTEASGRFGCSSKSPERSARHGNAGKGRRVTTGISNLSVESMRGYREHPLLSRILAAGLLPLPRLRSSTCQGHDRLPPDSPVLSAFRCSSSANRSNAIHACRALAQRAQARRALLRDTGNLSHVATNLFSGGTHRARYVTYRTQRRGVL
jgi:hypothetical protein